MAPPERHDFVDVLRAALAGDRVAEAAADLAPPLAQYRALRSALVRYRLLTAAGSHEPPLPATGTVHPGEAYAGLGALRWRLVTIGDLDAAASTSASSGVYEGPVVEAVRRFPDLDRLRLVALNIPMFQLWAWDSILPNGEPAFGMRAIVGRALSTETPVFVEQMRHVIFRPYWNVPRSILRKEILPGDSAGFRRRHRAAARHRAESRPAGGRLAASASTAGPGQLTRPREVRVPE
jgi:murein L,D-transpeptidase YcbB/YkuD